MPHRPGLGALTASALLGLLATLTLAPPAGAAAPADPADPAAPAERAGATHGPQALRELRASGGLERAAARAGMTPSGLARVLADPTTRLTQRGAVYYAEERRAATAGQVGASPGFAQVAPLADTFTLHSRPGAPRKIYLDFDGQNVSNTWWNEPDTNLPNGTHPPYSVDADPAFSTAERLTVQEVWARVSEDYAPFQVDVTTQDPGQAALDRSSPSDNAFGVRVLITPGTKEAQTLCGGGCSGIAWIGVFDRVLDVGSPGPAWVLTDLTWGSAWEIADTASHESGHTFGLQHDGYGTQAYYQGRGVWGPIMGSSSNPLVQWSNGDYTGSTETQDDLAVISGHGAPRVTDEYADTIASTSPAPGSLGAGSTGSASGVVSDRSDRDVLAYSHGACPVTFTLATASAGPDLDARLRLLDPMGTVIASVDPPATTSNGQLVGTGATWSGDLPAGTTYVEVDGVGQGAMPSAGYSDYGSVGRWTLSVTGCAPAPSDATAPSAPTALVLDADQSTGDVAVGWDAPSDDGGAPLLGYSVRVTSPSGTTTRTTTARSMTLQGLAPEATHTIAVTAVNAVGASDGVSGQVVLGPRAPSSPGVPTLTRTTTPGRATLAWTAPAQDWGHPVTGYQVSSPAIGPDPVTVTGRSLLVTGLADRETATYTVRALSEAGTGLPSSATLTYHSPARPGVPRNVRAASGALGGAVTAAMSWAPPASNGGSPVTGYRVRATRYDATGRALRTWTALRPASARSWVATLPRGAYRFRVAAVNVVGVGTTSASTALVRAR